MDVGALNLDESLVVLARVAADPAIRGAAELRHEFPSALSADDVVDELCAHARTPEPLAVRFRTFIAARIRGISL